MSKKIGILTFHDASNYGAVLQAYALKKSIEKVCNSVDIIDYKSNFIRDSYNPYDMSGNKVKAVARVLVYSSQLKRRNAIFSEFGKKYFSLSENKATNQSELKRLLSSYETIICGSDQVWNLDITHEDNSYFLPFQMKNIQKASYAASFGNYNFRDDKNIEFLKEFSFGSCREEQATQKLNELFDLNFECHVDPTLLLNSNEWNGITYEKRVIDDPYVLIYTVKDPNKLEQEAILYAKRNGFRIVQIRNRGKTKEIEYLVNQTPEQFLSLFRDAKAVFTNSFHGTVFSLIFQKQFLSELIAKDGLPNNRSQSLLKKLNLTDRFLEHGNGNMEREINWESVNSKIMYEQKRSMDYLEKVIQ